MKYASVEISTTFVVPRHSDRHKESFMIGMRLLEEASAYVPPCNSKD